MESGGDWCLIESDPGVFTELIKKFGVKGVEVEELYSLDSPLFQSNEPVYGLIFLFKWPKKGSDRGDVAVEKSFVRDADRLKEIFFAKQVINNACATQAIISILMNNNVTSSSEKPSDNNINTPNFELGSVLSDFKEFVSTFDSDMKGLALSNSQTIREVHNSFSRPQLFEEDKSTQSSDRDDIFHFISYVPINNRIYELDGTLEYPVDHGPVSASSSSWMTSVREVIEKRINCYGSDQIHFNLLAIVPDKVETLNNRISNCMDENEVLRLKSELSDEKSRHSKWRMDNIRRKHNYFPFIIEMLRMLASNTPHILDSVMEKAKTRQDKKLKLKMNKPSQISI